MSDAFALQRFVDAQEPVFSRVLAELSRGRKATHWMWFAFPQVAGLGSSAMSARYAIGSLAEAQAYLAHPILGARLRECVGLVLEHRDRSALSIFGSPDDAKLRSALTLFAEAKPDEPLFRRALDAFFDGKADPATLRLLDTA